MDLFQKVRDRVRESRRAAIEGTEIESFWLAGKTTIRELNRIGMVTMGDLAAADLASPVYQAALSPEAYETALAMQEMMRL